jgi:hypothetical protein
MAAFVLREQVHRVDLLIASVACVPRAAAAIQGFGSDLSVLFETDWAMLLLYGSFGLLGLALLLKLAVSMEERRNFRSQFFPTDRQIPIEPTPYSRRIWAICRTIRSRARALGCRAARA